MPRRQGHGDKAGTFLEAYDYTDENGTLLYQVVRFAPKSFRQRKPGPQDSWEWSLGDVQRVLFGLPTLAGQKVVYVVEGEKDVQSLRAIGVVATTNSGGAGKWREEYTRQLCVAGAQEVVVIPDNDESGRSHANDVAKSCHSAGLSVKVVALPGLAPKGDISDWLQAGRDFEELVALVAATPSFEPLIADRQVEAVDISAVLKSVIEFIRRYVVMGDSSAVATALWAAHTHVIEAFDCTPYLHITAATKRAGKTRLLEVLEPLVARPWLTGRTSAAALVRKVDAEKPTLLLDETDAAMSGEKDYAETLRGVLNTGYRRSGKATVCDGPQHRVRDFETFSAKAIAGIGALPGTVEDRSIRIELKRRTRDEPCERWRERHGHQEAAHLRAALATWAGQAISLLKDATPTFPTSLGDRQVDVWEPLLAIAELAGGEWPAMARAAAAALSGSMEDFDIRVELLRDIRAVFQELDVDVISTHDLLGRLNGLEDRPWASWSKGKPLTAHKLARLLAEFHVVPAGNVRFGEKVSKGYRRAAFEDAFARYLPAETLQRNNASKDGAYLASEDRCELVSCSDSKGTNTPNEHGACDEVAVQAERSRHVDGAGPGYAAEDNRRHAFHFDSEPLEPEADDVGLV